MDPLHTHWLHTPLGPMLAIADRSFLYVLEFEDQKRREPIGVFGKTEPICMIKKELDLYFKGELTAFQTPIQMRGTPFQIQVWKALQQIPFDKTVSYAYVAQAINKPLAVRAVAGANGANSLAIVVPCHRIINASGSIGGYAGGIERKQWLLAHEQIHGKENR